VGGRYRTHGGGVLSLANDQFIHRVLVGECLQEWPLPAFLEMFQAILDTGARRANFLLSHFVSTVLVLINHEFVSVCKKSTPEIDVGNELG
jgi:hypothetical protein